ncbi:MAG: hypothetical protein V3U68_04165 [Bacteroidota bacterium]
MSKVIQHLPSPAISCSVLTNRFKDPPPGKLFLLYGDPAVFPLSLTVATHALMQGSSIAVVDGANRFDVHLIASIARWHALDPHTVLDRIFISRGFTCYQMEAAITHRLGPFLHHVRSNTVLILGLLDTFYDEQAPFREVQQILVRVTATLEELKSRGISILLASQDWNVIPKERNQLLRTLKTRVNQIYRLEMSKENEPRLFWESPPARRAPLTGRAGISRRDSFGAFGT